MGERVSLDPRGGLLLDRFVRRPDGGLVDLATGRRAWLRVRRPGNGSGDAPWADQCAALACLRHPGLVSLLDFGVSACGAVLEVFDLPSRPKPWAGTRAEARHVLDGVGRAVAGADGFLTVGQAGTVIDRRGRAACLLWPERVPLPADAPRDHGTAPAWRVALAPVIEALETTATGGARVLYWCGPPGSGIRSAFASFARDARIRGFVPISTDCTGGTARRDRQRAAALAACLRHRHLVVFHDARQHVDADDLRGRRVGLSRLIAMMAEAGRPHLVIVARASGSEPGIVFGAARRTARLTRGFEPEIDPAPSLAADARAPYAVPGTDAGICRARDQFLIGRALALRGRHAPGERMMRRALGALERRRASLPAAWAWLTLARLVAGRGRTAAALALLDRAQANFDRADHCSGPVLVLIARGLAHTDEDRLHIAESTLQAAVAGAQALGDAALAVRAHLALARCFFWQGRFDAARGVLDRAAPESGRAAACRPGLADGWPSTVGRPPALPVSDAGTDTDRRVSLAWLSRPDEALEQDPTVAGWALRARLALCQADFVAAGAAAAQAARAADRRGRALDVCLAESAMAEVQAVLGDHRALGVHASLGLTAARMAHAPMFALRLRLILADGAARAGRTAAARRVLDRLERLDAVRLPFLFRRRIRTIRERCDMGCASADQSTASAGLVDPVGPAPGLAMSAEAGRVNRVPADPEFVGAILGLFALCQEADNQRALLGAVCARLQGDLDAASVAILCRAAETVMMVASAGRRPPGGGLAERAMALGQTVVGPLATGAGYEGASPVRYGGDVIGAIAARWPADRVPDLRKSAVLLTAAAAASAVAIRGALDRTAAEPPDQDGDGITLVGSSRSMTELRQLLARAAPAPFPVLIQGESGTGKELAARSIHAWSPRRGRRFCAVNCAAFGDDLLEAELFGHARGAFTGAVAERPGLFEAADGGTLFLDEVGELSPRAQAKLLRAIQDGEVRRIGENVVRAVDVRIVAATNRSLQQDVQDGRFRQDLLYRLDVIRVRVPALRVRPDDIPVLAARFWDEARARTGSQATLSPATVAALARYDWPGNVRELQNVMAAIAVTAPRRGVVGTDTLPDPIRAVAGPCPAGEGTLDAARRRFEDGFVRAALARAGGRRSRAAADLGVTRQGLAKLLVRLGIDPTC